LEKNPGRISLGRAVFVPVSPREMTSGTQMSVMGEREGTISGGRENGRGLLLLLGWKLSPRPFILSLFLFLFLF
jgi:hypothetical protein